MIASDAFFQNFKREFHRFCADENGATAIEYSLIAAGIAVAIIGTVASLGSTIKTSLFEKVANALP